ncbi:hypothetical protein DMUE_5642 [Dictyocoela muelleri]|nr:hypothetical protein DMUE_5642 [Dictyocoela muelleri]
MSLGNKYNNLEILGGDGEIFQMDETAFCRRHTIYNSTSEAAFIRRTKWVIRLISESSVNVRMKVLEYRTADSIHQFIIENLLPGSIIKSDGFSSYPAAIERAGCQHRFVNHNRGFVSED